MFNVARKTYKDLVDDVLTWTGDEDDQAQMRALAQQAVQGAHQKRLTEDRYSFMLHPKPIRLTTVAGVQNYSMHEAFLSPVYISNLSTGNPVKVVPYEQQSDFLPSTPTARTSSEYAVLQGMSKVKNQPTEAGVITATSSDGADNGKIVIVVGELADGSVEEETLTLPNAGVVEFTQILDVVKVDAEWVGTLTLTHADGTIILTLGPSTYGRQFRQLYFLSSPVGSEVLEYQFFRQPKPLRYDNDIPDMPYPFDRILVLDALDSLSGFTRATPAEQKRWQAEAFELQQSLAAQYQDTLTADSVPRYQTYIPR